MGIGVDLAECFAKDGYDLILTARSEAFLSAVSARLSASYGVKTNVFPIDLAAEGITSIIWCVGYTPDFSWVHLPVFTGRGAPSHHRGITAIPGLYFLGLPWRHTWGSGRFASVARDAAHLANHIKFSSPKARRAS